MVVSSAGCFSGSGGILSPPPGGVTLRRTIFRPVEKILILSHSFMIIWISPLREKRHSAPEPEGEREMGGDHRESFQFKSGCDNMKNILNLLLQRNCNLFSHTTESLMKGSFAGAAGIRNFYTKTRRSTRNLIFSGETYPIANASPEKLTDVVIKFFNEELKAYDKYFLLLKVKFTAPEGSWRTLHHGVVCSKINLDNYLEFIKSQLSISREEYSDEKLYEQIAFHYFRIPKNKQDKFPDTKWTHIARSPTPEKLIISSDLFTKYNIPIDTNYEFWGSIEFKSDTTLIINGASPEKYFIVIDSSGAGELLRRRRQNTIYLHGDKIKIIDQQIDNRYFKRTYQDCTFYCDGETKEILLTLKSLRLAGEN